MSETMETGWLVELNNDNEGPKWLVYHFGFYEWTKDSIEATRFCRRQDADGVDSIFDDLPVRITEHQW